MFRCLCRANQQILARVLRKGDTVILDNLSSHKNEEAARLIVGAGARLLLLPAYGPDLNPIETMPTPREPSTFATSLTDKANRFRHIRHADRS